MGHRFARSVVIWCVGALVVVFGVAACTQTPPPTTTSTTVVTETGIPGDYAITVGSSGSVTIVRSGVTGPSAQYTVFVKTPFRLTGATCSLPAGTVVATFSGAGPSFAATNNSFDATTCAVGSNSAVTVPTVRNSDGSITLGLNQKTGTYLLSRTANGVSVASPAPTGDYAVNVSGSIGAVSVVRSGTGSSAQYTVSVKTPFRLTGAACSLPTGTVVATFSGAGPTFPMTNNSFDATTCAVGGNSAVTTPTWLNNDNSITLGLNVKTGFYLLTRTGSGVSVASPVPTGDYAVNVSGSIGAVTVAQVASQYTVSVKTPFRLTGAACTLPAGTVVATFSGAGPSFTATNNSFNLTTCAVGGNSAVTTPTWLNSDNSITLGLNVKTGFYLLTRS
jgi:hypothetical protein